MAGWYNKVSDNLSNIVDAIDYFEAELDEAKLKLGAEVSELKEKAKSWKEKADSNKDGKLDFEEIYTYVRKRMSSRHSAPQGSARAAKKG